MELSTDIRGLQPEGSKKLWNFLNNNTFSQWRENYKKKKNMVFRSVESLQQVVNVINEVAAAVNDKSLITRESAISEVLTGALGAGRCGIGFPFRE